MAIWVLDDVSGIAGSEKIVPSVINKTSTHLDGHDYRSPQGLRRETLRSDYAKDDKLLLITSPYGFTFRSNLTANRVG